MPSTAKATQTRKTFRMACATTIDVRATPQRSDGFAPLFKGVRTSTLAANPDGSTSFTMVEVFSGVMLPMIRRSLPDVGPSFVAYATDLKREAERAV